MKHLFFISFFCVCMQMYAADPLACFAQIASDREKNALGALQQMSETETDTGSGFNSFQSLVDAVDKEIQLRTESLEAQIRVFKGFKSDDQRMAYIAGFSEDQKQAMQAALIEYLRSNGREDLVENALKQHPDTVVVQEQAASSQSFAVAAAVAPRESSPVVVKESKPKKKKGEKVGKEVNQDKDFAYNKGRLRSSKPISVASVEDAYMYLCEKCWAHIKGRSFFEEHMLLCKKH